MTIIFVELSTIFSILNLLYLSVIVIYCAPPSFYLWSLFTNLSVTFSFLFLSNYYRNSLFFAICFFFGGWIAEYFQTHLAVVVLFLQISLGNRRSIESSESSGPKIYALHFLQKMLTFLLLFLTLTAFLFSTFFSDFAAHLDLLFFLV